jgi:hypothetical protein
VCLCERALSSSGVIKAEVGGNDFTSQYSLSMPDGVFPALNYVVCNCIFQVFLCYPCFTFQVRV